MKRSSILLVCTVVGLGILALLALAAAPSANLNTTALRTPSPTALAIATPENTPGTGSLDTVYVAPSAVVPDATQPPLPFAPSATSIAPATATEQPLEVSSSTAAPTPTNAPTDIPTLAPALTPTTVPSPTPDLPVMVEARLARVVDGDTIDVVLAGQTERVRLIGMDTPETNGAPICYGQEATAYTQHLLDASGGKIWPEKDVSETDRYGRLLRYVWLAPPTGSAIGNMLDEQLVADGYAQVYTFPPDVKYVDRLQQAERTAKAGNRGLWGACSSFGAPAIAPTSLPLPTTLSLPPKSTGGDSSDSGSGDLPYDPNGPDRDCSDFTTHDEAQRFFIAAGGPSKDPHRLDGDHDGIACETLP